MEDSTAGVRSLPWGGEIPGRQRGDQHLRVKSNSLVHAVRHREMSEDTVEAALIEPTFQGSLGQCKAW